MSRFVTIAPSGLNLYVSLQQRNADNSLGLQWNETASAWQASVADADAKIPLAEGSGRYLRRYVAGESDAFGSFTGHVLATVHNDDDANDHALGVHELYFDTGSLTGEPVSGGQASISPISLINERLIWRMKKDGEMNTTGRVVTVVAGGAPTLAFDVSAILNPGTAVTNVTSVTVDNTFAGTAPTIANQTPSADGQQIQFELSGTTKGRHEIKAVYATSDGQSDAVQGQLRIDD